ncbi:MAG: TatD family hydrolase [Tannerella sp.]|jgi:TatD DNase family protein|nr:TatD family hydrolase [Tannerella sp.]
MIYCDIHSHQPPVHPEDIAVISLDLREPSVPSVLLCRTRQDSVHHRCENGRQNPSTAKGVYFSAGIHPWYPDKSLMEKVREYARMPSVVAIGETGLDKITAKDENSFKLQRELFLMHARLAEETGKPLVIHCVKAWDELLHVRKSIKPLLPWIVHGFRGHEILAEQLLDTGLYLSFGANCNPKALKAAWEKRRLLAETDDKGIDIRDIYRLLAKDLNISEEKLSEAIAAFFHSVIR